jgi:hypothetical protein
LLVIQQTNSFFSITAGLCEIDNNDNGNLDFPLCNLLPPYAPQ